MWISNTFSFILRLWESFFLLLFPWVDSIYYFLLNYPYSFRLVWEFWNEFLLYCILEDNRYNLNWDIFYLYWKILRIFSQWGIKMVLPTCTDDTDLLSSQFRILSIPEKTLLISKDSLSFWIKVWPQYNHHFILFIVPVPVPVHYFTGTNIMYSALKHNLTLMPSYFK